MNKLEIDSVRLEFGRHIILTDVYMHFETGCITGVLGRNGTGKSCLLKIIYGTLNSQYSNIRFNGQALVNAFRQPVKVRYMPQSSFIPKYLPLKNVLDIFNCDIELLIYRFPEFTNYLKKPFRYFSFGQKRLIEAYLILTSDSEFVMLDEPFSYLMPIHVEELKKIILSEKKRKGIIITDHMYRDMLDITDNIYLINDCTAYLIKTPEELRSFGYLP